MRVGGYLSLPRAILAGTSAAAAVWARLWPLRRPAVPVFTTGSPSTEHVLAMAYFLAKEHGAGLQLLTAAWRGENG